MEVYVIIQIILKFKKKKEHKLSTLKMKEKISLQILQILKDIRKNDQLHANNFNNLCEINKFFKSYK